ncbi:MAG TPA: BlaI/MecI/CopY family transcriptional regulator [Gemmataceae bacterium]|jgi:predicted transcriptional regulator
MARKPSKNLTERELEIMQVLWSLGQARLGEVQEALNQKSGEAVAPSTVATQLNLLIHKGYVKQTGRPGRSHYVPTCGREETTRDLLSDFLSRVGLGRAPAFLIQLLRDERLTAEDRAALQEILRESEPPTPHRSRSRPVTPPSSEETTS